ncbi:hypothetical protein Pve01_76660 [Planomonospora venezuelensis]|nr:hypothetical protein Pve01_76660 [Planomonospora venezuelensis]
MLGREYSTRVHMRAAAALLLGVMFMSAIDVPVPYYAPVGEFEPLSIGLAAITVIVGGVLRLKTRDRGHRL